LAKAGPGKIIEMADKLHRQDVRLAEYMYALQAALAEENPPRPLSVPIINKIIFSKLLQNRRFRSSVYFHTLVV
jgi:hypothetical protein